MAPTSLFDNALGQSVAYVVGSELDDTTGWVTVENATQDSMCISIHVASKGTSGVQVDVRLFDSGTTDWVYLIKNGPVPVGSTLVVIDNNKIVIKAGQSIDVRCKTPGEDVDVLVSLVDNVNA